MAKVDVIMPQMGESIAEGTITRWIKKVGDAVERDEPIFEISTDKVDAEIPAPSAGVLAEIKVAEGETVEVDTVVAVLETDAAAAAEAAPAEAPAAEAPAAETPAAEAEPEPAAPAPASAPAAPAAPVAAPAGAEVVSLEELRRTRSSPVVRKIAAEHRIDIRQVQGSGIQGRVTKKDILAFVEAGGAAAAPAAAPPAPAAYVGVPGKRETMSVMRQKIAEHMIVSRRTSAHVTTVFEVDLDNVAKQRAEKGAEFQARNGVKLTYTPIIAAAAVESLRDFPVVNASMDGNEVVYHQHVNLGVAVALEWGLIVPVVKGADEKNLVGLARSITDVAERARTKKLQPDEVQGGTFTITNPGIYGGLFGTPIINQPQVAILGVGGIEKRPVVINDAIAIHTMCYLALSFDHRLIDGAVADQFMANLKQRLETFRV
jgi:2-oxoglutarate dehydrogenase E2 component (dihydrolipoamide succinyltransferase)